MWGNKTWQKAENNLLPGVRRFLSFRLLRNSVIIINKASEKYLDMFGMLKIEKIK